ncbi:MAG TPA: BTAD domain-containing putative transcriptional regulator [Trebonia sp.]|nr:BTAD domain-containing putative transcriptional regulator [Trebonia sp.]
MQVAMLGPLEVRDDTGSPREVSGTRLRTLLMLLALRPGQVVAASGLIDELWGEHLPADAPNALQALVSRLRRALGEPEAVASTDAGYQLRLDGGDIDVFRFERLAARGRAALRASPGEAASILAAALGLWRGTPLPEAAQTESGRAAVARLTELRLAVAEDHVDAQLRLGEPSPRLVAELEGLLAASPTRETLAGQLMRALAATGRRGAALAVYEQTRQRLADELGTAPSPQLAAVHASLLREDGRRPAPAPPQTNLPTALTSFIGRESDLAEVETLLRRHRLVTLTGSGGAGKTRLAIEAARAALSGGGFPGGAWLTELAPVTDPGDVAPTMLNALGLREQGLLITRSGPATTDHQTLGEEVLERLTSALAGRSALLVLDNCEHLIAIAATVADRILTRCPGVRILATSREPLNITGEAVWTVGPLPALPAERLFAERASAASPSFRRTLDSSGAVAHICRSLDGMPLAIELAAARTRTMTAEQIAGRLDQRFQLLTGGSRIALPRHQTLRAVVDWSWDLLDDTERALLSRLSVFTGGATLEAAEQVCGIPPVAAQEVIDRLAVLADKSLVTVRHTEDGPRYGMLETIREYSRARLSDAGEAATLRRRHAEHFLGFAERAQPYLFGPQQLEWLRRMGAEADNVHTAIRQAVTAGEVDTAIGLVGGFGWYWWLRSQKQEGGDLAALALRSAPSTAQAADDQAMLGRLTAAYAFGGMLVMDSPQMARGVAWLREAETMAGRLRPPASTTFPYAALALAGALREMTESGGRMPPVALDSVVTDPHPWVGGMARIMRAQITLNHGGPIGQAKEDFHQALAAFQELGERWGLAMSVGGLAMIEEWQGEWAAATAHYQQAIDLAAELGTTEDETQFRLYLARAQWAHGGEERERSRAEVARALRDADRLGWPEVTSFAAYMAGTLARLDGDLATARRQLESAASIADSAALHRVPGKIGAMTLTALGYLCAAESNLDEARSWHERALAAVLPTEDAPVIGGTLTGLADLELRLGHADRAATLLGAAEGVRGAPDRSDIDGERAIAAAREALGTTAYETAFERGRDASRATLEEFLRPGA